VCITDHEILLDLFEAEFRRTTHESGIGVPRNVSWNVRNA